MSRYLECDGLCMNYGNQPVLRGLDLRVERGVVAGIHGPSGAGKTTLLRIIAGLCTPGAGTVRLDDRLLNAPECRVSPHERGIGMVMQEPALWPHMTALGHLRFVLGAHGVRGRARRKEALGLLHLVELDGKARRYPHQLSGGEAQRLSLARALASHPRLLLLDEPFTGAGEALRGRLFARLRERQRRDNMTVLCVMHQVAALRDWADTTVSIAALQP